MGAKFLGDAGTEVKDESAISNGPTGAFVLNSLESLSQDHGESNGGRMNGNWRLLADGLTLLYLMFQRALSASYGSEFILFVIMFSRVYALNTVASFLTADLVTTPPNRHLYPLLNRLHNRPPFR
jgi:hypothetical protein